MKVVVLLVLLLTLALTVLTLIAHVSSGTMARIRQSHRFHLRWTDAALISFAFACCAYAIGLFSLNWHASDYAYCARILTGESSMVKDPGADLVLYSGTFFPPSSECLWSDGRSTHQASVPLNTTLILSLLISAICGVKSVQESASSQMKIGEEDDR